MTDDELNEILETVRQIKNSPAMNGGFVNLVKSVEHIKNTQSNMATDVNTVMIKQEESGNKLKELHEALYDPDIGIYKRINDSISMGISQEDHLRRLDEQSEELQDEIGGHSDRIVELETTRNNLKEVAGERLEHLDSVVKMDKNTKKLFWAGVAAVGAFVLKELGPAILALL